MGGVEINGSSVTVPKWLASWVLSMLTASVLGLVGMVWGLWGAQGVLDKRVAVIEGNRFTATQALEMRKDITEAIPSAREFSAVAASLVRIEGRLTALERRLP